jgi:hypothetical protein
MAIVVSLGKKRNMRAPATYSSGIAGVRSEFSQGESRDQKLARKSANTLTINEKESFAKRPPIPKLSAISRQLTELKVES